MKFYILLSFFLVNILSSAPVIEEMELISGFEEIEPYSCLPVEESVGLLLEFDEMEPCSYFPVEELGERLEEQDYKEVLKILFSLKEPTHKQQALEWARAHAEEGHVPLMYFIFITIFNPNDKESIIESFYLYICSMFIIEMDLACFNGIYSDEITYRLDINILKSFETRYIDELYNVIDSDFYLEAYERALSFLKDKTDYPDPAWIGSYCGRTVRKRPGLKFKPVTETIKASFFRDPEEIAEKRRLAYDVAKNRFDYYISYMVPREEKFRKAVNKFPLLKYCKNLYILMCIGFPVPGRY